MPRVGLALVLVGAFGFAISAGQGWVNYTIDDPLLGPGERSATGYAVSPGLSGVALVALAGIVAALLTRRIWQRTCAAIVAAAAAWAVWLVGAVLHSPDSAAARAARSEPFGAGASISEAAATIWPWTAVAAGIALAVGVIIVWFPYGRSGPAKRVAPSRRAGPDRILPLAERQRRDNAAAWDDLTRGEDPTR